MTQREAIFKKVFCKCEGLSKPLIIGINGVDTSGKTVFAKQLSEYFKAKGQQVQLVHLDDFHNPSAVRRQGADELTAYYDNAFNLGLLEKEILRPIKSGEVFQKELHLLDLQSDTFTNKQTYKVTKDTALIVEGVLLFREPVLPYLDIKIFIDISFDEMLKRAALRDLPLHGESILEKYKNKYIPIQRAYLSECDPKSVSNFVIDNNNYETPLLIP